MRPDQGQEQQEPDHAAAAFDLIYHGLAYLRSAAVGAAARLGIADRLADGPLTAAEIADRTGADGAHLRRLLRFLASLGIFQEDETGRFHLTPSAQALRTGTPHSLRDALVAFTDPMFWLPANRLDETVTRGRTVFDEIFEAPFFAHLENDPAAGTAFHAGMANYSRFEDPAVAAGYPFPATGTVVDVGGGHGGLLHAVLSTNPGLTGVLYDREAVLSGHRLDGPELAGRWRTEAGDFFESVPAGADVYILKHILHDWDDEGCLRILRACRRAMADGARILAVDVVVPPGNDPDFGKALDILMMSLLPGRERDRAEFESLFARAGLSVNRVLPTAAPVSILEVVAA